MIHFIVEAKPVPKARPRFLKFSGRVYTPQTTLSFEKLIAFEAKKFFPMPSPHAIRLKIIFHFKKAKSNKKTEHTQRPDIDNVLKSVMDGLNEVAFVDDCQVVSLRCEKRLASKDMIEIFLSEKSLS